MQNRVAFTPHHAAARQCVFVQCILPLRVQTALFSIMSEVCGAPLFRILKVDCHDCFPSRLPSDLFRSLSVICSDHCRLCGDTKTIQPNAEYRQFRTSAKCTIQNTQTKYSPSSCSLVGSWQSGNVDEQLGSRYVVALLQIYNHVQLPKEID